MLHFEFCLFLCNFKLVWIVSIVWMLLEYLLISFIEITSTKNINFVFVLIVSSVYDIHRYLVDLKLHLHIMAKGFPFKVLKLFYNFLIFSMIIWHIVFKFRIFSWDSLTSKIWHFQFLKTFLFVWCLAIFVCFYLLLMHGKCICSVNNARNQQ